MGPDDVRGAAAEAEARLLAAWSAVVVAMRNTYDLEDLAALIAAGRFEDAADAVIAKAGRFGTTWTREFVRAGDLTSEHVEAALRSAGRGEINVDFDMTNDGAVRAMRDNQLRLVQEVSAQQRRATREALADGVNRGANPIEQARNFRSSLGLTRSQVRAVNNYRRLLEERNPESLQRALRDRRFDPSVRRAIENERPLTKSQIDNMVTRYRQRYVKHRSEVIARTESLRAVNQGMFSMYKQAVENGTVTAEQLSREWNTAGDGRVRTMESTGGETSHASMHGQVVRGLDQPFISGGGNALMYPGDPSAPGSDTIQCRCAVGVRMSFAGNVGAASVQVIEG